MTEMHVMKQQRRCSFPLVRTMTLGIIPGRRAEALATRPFPQTADRKRTVCYRHDLHTSHAINDKADKQSKRRDLQVSARLIRSPPDLYDWRGQHGARWERIHNSRLISCDARRRHCVLSRW